MNPDQVQVRRMGTAEFAHGAPALELLDDTERTCALRYRPGKSRDRFVLARTFLRRALGQYLDIPAAAVRFRYGHWGKPELEGGGDLCFNLSHSGEAVVLAVSRGREVGIDVETTGRHIDARGLAKRFFARAEADWVMSHAAPLRPHAFFTCWTGKEAYIKARGDGLRFPLDAFQVLPAADGLTLQLKVYGDSAESERWSMQTLPLGAGLCAAIAVEGSGWTLHMDAQAKEENLA